MPDWHTTVHENSSSCRLNESSKQKQNSKRKIGKEKKERDISTTCINWHNPTSTKGTRDGRPIYSTLLHIFDCPRHREETVECDHQWLQFKASFIFNFVLSGPICIHRFWLEYWEKFMFWLYLTNKPIVPQLKTCLLAVLPQLVYIFCRFCCFFL